MYILALENRLGARPLVCHNFKPPLQNLLHSLPRYRVETLHSHNEGCGAAVSPARAASPRPLAARALTSLRALTGRMRPDARRCMQRTRGSWLKTSHAQAGGNPNPNHNPNPTLTPTPTLTQPLTQTQTQPARRECYRARHRLLGHCQPRRMHRFWLRQWQVRRRLQPEATARLAHTDRRSDRLGPRTSRCSRWCSRRCSRRCSRAQSYSRFQWYPSQPAPHPQLESTPRLSSCSQKPPPPGGRSGGSMKHFAQCVGSYLPPG